MVCVLVATSASAQVRAPALQDEAVAWLQSYIRVDTINPPGNEAAGVQFLKKILDAEGIPYDTAESAPGRGNIWARLKGGDQPALILLHHMDVVPANKAIVEQRSPFRRDQGWLCLRPRCARYEVERDPAPGGICRAPPIEDRVEPRCHLHGHCR